MAAEVAFDSRQFRDVMGQFCTGVVIVTAVLDDEPCGFAAQSFVSLSLEPPLVGLCPAKTSTSWPKIRAAGNYCINVLASSQAEISNNFAKSWATFNLRFRDPTSQHESRNLLAKAVY